MSERLNAAGFLLLCALAIFATATGVYLVALVFVLMMGIAVALSYIEDE